LDMFRGSEGGQFQSPANASSQGRSGSRGRGSYLGGRGCGNGGCNGGCCGGSNHDKVKQGGSHQVPCLICKKTSHEARDYWFRCDEDDHYKECAD
jgi:hypothetical protein